MGASIGLTQEVRDYIAHANRPEHAALLRCREETQTRLGSSARMQISPEQGAFLQMLVRMIHARRAIEVGVFTGYSALAVALALREMHGEDAHLLACDISEEWTAQAKHYWGQAGVEHVIDLELAPAAQTLRHKISQGLLGEYDFAFIDADKTGYDAYYELCLGLLRVGGVMVFDNVLWGGDVAEPAKTDADTQALRALAQKAKADPRVDTAFTSLGDGLLVCLKRPTGADAFMP